MPVFQDNKFISGEFNLTAEQYQVIVGCLDEQAGKLTRRVANSLEEQLQKMIEEFKQQRVPWKSQPPLTGSPPDA